MVGEDGEGDEDGGNGRGIQCGNNGCKNTVINLLVNRDQTIYWWNPMRNKHGERGCQ